MDYVARLELLAGLIDTYKARLLVVDKPSLQLDHASRLEQRGLELIAQADKIRADLQADALQREVIENELRLAELERDVIRIAQQQRITLRFSPREYAERYLMLERSKKR